MILVSASHFDVRIGTARSQCGTASTGVNAAHQLLEEGWLSRSRVQDRLLQALQHGFHMSLELVGILVIDGLLLVVDAGVVKNLGNIRLEVFPGAVTSIHEFLLHSLQIHRFLYNLIVIRNLLGVNGLLERPRVLMTHQRFQDVLALLLECLLLTFSCLIVGLSCPASLAEALDLLKLILLLPLMELEAGIYPHVTHLKDLGDNGISLLLQDLRDVHIVNVFNDLALHHGATVVIFDVSLPLSLGHVRILTEALLLEKLRRIVIRVGTEIVQALLLSMIFQPIHKPCT